jgi:polyhydroxybutyrate depolymerase
MPSQSCFWIAAATALLWATGCTDDTGGGGDGGQPSQGGGGAGGTVSGGGGGAGGGGAGGAQASCAPGSKDGPLDGAVGELTPLGVDYNVRTPADYAPTVGHPLIVVYAPAGGSATTTEQFTGLTAPATARGYVIAYLNHVLPSGDAQFADAGTVPQQIIARWCIDERRVYTTGHSDGGSLASVTGLFEVTDPKPAAIAPSAAGVSTSTLSSVDCPAPLPVMVLHSSNDSLFPVPSFGLEPSQWWASCASCAGPGATLPNGCIVHDGCADGVEVQYCEGTGQHGSWPPLNEAMLDFFDRFVAP